MAPNPLPDAHELQQPGKSKNWAADLTMSAKKWLADAMKAWTEGDFAKVAVLAPLAVEHLGKALLWRTNPVLVVPLTQDAEHSLMSLATKPDLADPRVRTVSLSVLLRRLEQIMGSLPIDRKRCTRMVEIRNGAIHAGSPSSSLYVLIDCLVLIKSLLERLAEDQNTFFGEHHLNVKELLEKKRTEVGHTVAAKRARARLHLAELEERVGETAFREVTDLLEGQAELIDPDDFGINLYAIKRTCPECGSEGRLLGRLDAEAEPDWDVEPLGGGEYQAFLAGFEWTLTLYPQVFTCNVCRLTLADQEELREAHLPIVPEEVQMEDLGEDFDPALLDARQNFA
jgi:hypothetical protein